MSSKSAWAVSQGSVSKEQAKYFCMLKQLSNVFKVKEQLTESL
jgi:hypothetical protein